MKRYLRKLTLLCLAALLSGCGEKAEPLPVETTFPAVTAAAETEPITVPEETAPVTAPAETEPETQSFWLTFTGDCTFGSNPVNYYAGYGFPKTVGEDYAYPFANVLTYFENDECTLINLEGPLCDSGSPAQKKHTFRGPTAYARILTENSVEAVTLANNHTLDYGKKGYQSTKETLDASAIPFVEENASRIFTTENGLTVGLYGAVYYSLDMEDMVAEIAAMKEQGVDVIIYAPHWGAELYYTPNETQKTFGYAAIDAGADIVWGSHPHVLQPVEEYGDGVIFYSLGNFSFGGNIYPSDFDTALIRQEILRDSDGTVRLGQREVIPACVSSVADHNNFQPTPYPENSADYLRVLKKLGLAQ